LARCRAMVAGPEEVDRLFAAALEAQAPTHQTDRARTLVAYGRALVALDRSDDAQHPLGEALELFRESRLPGWENHVRRLRGDGPAPEPRPRPDPAELTEVERQVLSMVMQRRRNREIATTMFVSLRTVEGHLTHIFRKLGVSTKAQLVRQLGAGEEGGASGSSARGPRRSSPNGSRPPARRSELPADSSL
jgi:DNA-binding CsgD family transcriptional regulator